MIAAHDITLRRGGRQLLDAVSLAVRPGEVVALVGPNGAGKSTLLRVMTGELTPNAGAVTWAGRSLGACTPLALARGRAVVSQQARIAFPMTAAEIVALGRLPWHGTPQGAPARQAGLVAAALARAGVPEALWHRHYDTLSGGEQQRIQLARALAQIEGAPAPVALFLDEPTASLDPGHAAALLRCLRALARERGAMVLVVLHDLNQAGFVADRVALLREGRLEAEGRPGDMLSAERLGVLYGVRFRAAGGLLAPDFAA
ncbi:iron complex transport system ATP-binding protein [Humitalea rosea]|uniref:Iron complex transport system ATP-binding protein n=1 Tax=Humitalea rosea TaxID=990373 RepID=A0A2W7IKG4_9PROT|nr:heme ABC transporter ATP-binding protein [Humitalea rosea]PZW46507.1 iron complex transport system ATP-binding protein [Humitalea rosea]